jgi:hypothetical protein
MGPLLNSACSASVIGSPLGEEPICVDVGDCPRFLRQGDSRGAFGSQWRISLGPLREAALSL